MSTLAVNAVTDANGGNTATINSMTPTADSLQGFRNRIINGDMRIDQRNAGAAVTVNANSNFYPVDRFHGRGQGSDGVFTVQQDSDAPTGFNNSLKTVVTTADASIGATQSYMIRQAIEGFNVADFGWGTASAKTVTLSFWVRSSLTGTFGGAFYNNGGTRSYPFTYSISSADTWEYKTVTVAGDTSGTWLTNNGIGLYVNLSLGSGADRLGTANSWAGSFFTGATGQTQVIGTLNATWYVTGVQLEVGSVATPFERRDYGRELMMCQRYYYQITGNATQTNSYIGPAVAYGATTGLAWINLPVVARTNAPSSFVSNQVTAFSNALTGVSSFAIGAINTSWSSQNNAAFTFTATGMSTTQPYFFALNSSSTAYIGFSWEL